MFAAWFDDEGRVLALKGSDLRSEQGKALDWEYLKRMDYLPEPSRKFPEKVDGEEPLQLLAYDGIGLVVRFIDEERRAYYLADPEYLRGGGLELLDPEDLSLSPYRL